MKTFKTLTTALTESKGKDVEDMTDLQLLRRGMVEELNAVTLYEDMAEQATDPRVKELFLDVAKEEKLHMEEFEQLISRIDPDWDEAHEDAEKEIENMFGAKEED